LPTERADRMIRSVAGVLAVVVLVLALIWGFQRRLIYLPMGTVPPADRLLDSVREVTLRTGDDLELGAWYVTPAGADPRLTVLVANGNAGNRSYRAPLARALTERGFAVLLFDYRGFGGNSGRPSEQGLARDARAAYEFLVDEEGIPPQRLLYFGESLGAAVVTELATEHPPAGLVLRSPFVDLASVGRVHYPFLPVALMLKDEYPLARHLAALDLPVTVVYGGEDSIVPTAQSRAVAEAARDVVAVELAGANHNDRVLLDGDELLDAIDQLAERAAAAEDG